MSNDEKFEKTAHRIARTATILVAAALILTGCGGSGDTSPPEATPASPATATASVDPYAANLGDNALDVGDTRRGRQVETTLEEIKSPYPPGEYRQPESGNEFVGLRIEQCTADNADPSETTYNGEWYAVTASGEEYTSSLSWDDWPAPKFPELVSAVPGRCVKGWIVLEVPEGTGVETILWRPDGEAVAEWRAAS